MQFVRAEGVREKSVGGDLALYVEAHRSIHVLNRSARLIWECLKDPLTADELHTILIEAFAETDEHVLRADLQDTLDEFARLGIVRASVPQA